MSTCANAKTVRSDQILKVCWISMVSKQKIFIGQIQDLLELLIVDTHRIDGLPLV